MNAQATGKGHLGSGNGESTFAQIVARSHGTAADRLMQRRERCSGSRCVDGGHLPTRQTTNETKGVIKNEIAPLLREYWFDDAAQAEELIQELG